ncbi:MAG TPA: thioredoxin domain-containing protein [Candidatus Sulfotelmatobacter sp.]|nr:thioredoxin domain-containing protein [Candidatus Sulfotelmatobacter sp.]
MNSIRRSCVVLILVCLGCVAQSTPPDLARKIERQVRAYYTIPAGLKVTVGSIAPSTELPGYDSVSVTIDNGEGKLKDYKFLLSKDRNTMLRLTKFDMTRDPFEDLMSKIDVKGRPSRGAKGSKVVVVNFDDFECPFCSRMHQILFPEILREYGDRVTFYYKDYPLDEIHPWATHAAVDANCLAALNPDAYWDFADYIHANKQQVDNEKSSASRLDIIDRMALLQGQRHNVDLGKLSSCVKAQNEDEVKASVKEADDLGVNATPTLFINGQKIDGAVPVSEIRAALDSALKDAGLPVPVHGSQTAAPASR